MKFVHPFLFLAGLLLGSMTTLLAQTPVPPNQPEQDCIWAFPICSSTLSVPNTYQGEGLNPNEVDPIPSCLSTGERNSVWLQFQAVSSGLICFDIAPVDSVDDYDWAIYDLSNHTCADIFATPSLEVSCNFSALPGTTGPNGAPGGQNEPCLSVQAGEWYVILVSNYSGTATGFTIDFSASTATIYDTTNVQISTVSNLPTLDGLILVMDQPILCSQLDTSDFTITDANGAVVPMLSASPLSCANSFTDSVAILFPTTYSATQLLGMSAAITSDLIHLCNLDSINNYIFPRVFTHLNVQTSIINIAGETACEGDSIILSTPFSGDPEFVVSWMPGNIQADELQVLATSGTSYSVTVSHPNSGLAGTDQIDLELPAYPDWELLPDLMLCEDSLLISVPDSFATYLWSTGDNTPQIWVNPADLGALSLRLSSQDGCVIQDSFLLELGELPQVAISYELDSTQASSISLFSNASNADSLFWDFGDGNTGSGADVTHTYASSGMYQVIVQAEGPCGTAFDSLQVAFSTAGLSLLSSEVVQLWLMPGTDVLALRLNQPDQAQYLLELYNATGQLVWQQSNIGSGESHWTLSNFPKGLFLASLRTKTGELAYRCKLIH